MTDKELDKLLSKKISEIEIPKKIKKINIESLVIKKSDTTKRSKKVLIAASIVLVAIISITALIYKSKRENNNTIIADSQITEKTEEIKEDAVVINVDKDKYSIEDISEAGSYFTSNIIALYKYYIEKGGTDDLSGIVIAKVNSLSYTNYDRCYTKDETIEDEYVPVRTIASITIEKCFLGNYEVGASYEIRSQGGVLEYSEYMKYWENTNSISNLDDIVQEYNTYVQEGKTKIYVSEYGKDNVKLEEGKTYLMLISPKTWGDYWISSYGNLLREYDEKTNSILNNETGEYENLDELLK